MFESARAASGASAVDRCEIITDHGPGEASDLLRGGLGGPGLGLDVLEDCAPSAALLLLVGHNFLDSEGLLATRPLEPFLRLQRFFYLKHPPVTAIGV